MTQPETVAVDLTIHEWRRYRRERLGLSPQDVLNLLIDRGVVVSRQTLWRAETGRPVSESVCEAIDQLLRGGDDAA